MKERWTVGIVKWEWCKPQEADVFEFPLTHSIDDVIDS